MVADDYILAWGSINVSEADLEPLIVLHYIRGPYWLNLTSPTSALAEDYGCAEPPWTDKILPSFDDDRQLVTRERPLFLR
jgi:hypothetical protein